MNLRDFIVVSRAVKDKKSGKLTKEEPISLVWLMFLPMFLLVVAAILVFIKDR